MALSKYLKLAQQALQSEKGRTLGRKATDGIATAGNRITKNRYADRIEKGRTAINKHLDTPGDPGRGEAPRP